jgi:hypothetical protein
MLALLCALHRCKSGIGAQDQGTHACDAAATAGVAYLISLISKQDCNLGILEAFKQALEAFDNDAGSDMRALQVQEQNMVLKAGERVRVALRLRPLRPGLLTLTGLEWLLQEHAPGRRLFVPRRPKHKRSASK